jgi:hypothetical protein
VVLQQGLGRPAASFLVTEVLVEKLADRASAAVMAPGFDLCNHLGGFDFDHLGIPNSSGPSWCGAYGTG